MMRELEALRDFFASATLTAVVDVPFIILTLVLVAAIGGKVVFVPGIMVPLVILVGWLTHPALERLSARTMGEGLQKQSVLVEAIGGLETVKTLGRGAAARRGAGSKAVQQHSDSSLRQRLVSTIGVTFATSAGTISYAGVVILGVGLIADRELTMGGLIACSILAGRAIAPLAQISQLLSRLTSTRTAYRQINEMMKMPLRRPGGRGAEALRSRGQDRVPQRRLQISGRARTGARRSQLHDRAGRACRPARPGRLGQVDHRPADPRPLSARGRAGHGRRHRRPPARPRRACAPMSARRCRRACC